MLFFLPHGTLKTAERCTRLRLHLSLKAAQICCALTAQPESVFADAVYGLPLATGPHPVCGMARPRKRKKL